MADFEPTSEHNASGVTRRQFFQTSGAIAAGAAAPDNIISSMQHPPKIPTYFTGINPQIREALKIVGEPIITTREWDHFFRNVIEPNMHIEEVSPSIVNSEYVLEQLATFMHRFCEQMLHKHDALQLLLRSDLAALKKYADETNDLSWKQHESQIVTGARRISELFANHAKPDAKLLALANHLLQWSHESDEQHLSHLKQHLGFNADSSNERVVNDLTTYATLLLKCSEDPEYNLKPNEIALLQAPHSNHIIQLIQHKFGTTSQGIALINIDEMGENVPEYIKHNMRVEQAFYFARQAAEQELGCHYEILTDMVARPTDDESSSIQNPFRFPWLNGASQSDLKFCYNVYRDTDKIPSIAEQCLTAIENIFVPSDEKGGAFQAGLMQQLHKQIPSMLARKIPEVMSQYFPEYWRSGQKGNTREDQWKREFQKKHPEVSFEPTYVDYEGHPHSKAILKSWAAAVKPMHESESFIR